MTTLLITPHEKIGIIIFIVLAIALIVLLSRWVWEYNCELTKHREEQEKRFEEFMNRKMWEED